MVGGAVELRKCGGRAGREGEVGKGRCGVGKRAVGRPTRGSRGIAGGAALLPCLTPPVPMLVGEAEVSTRVGGGWPLAQVTLERQVPFAARTTPSLELFKAVACSRARQGAAPSPSAIIRGRRRLYIVSVIAETTICGPGSLAQGQRRGWLAAWQRTTPMMFVNPRPPDRMAGSSAKRSELMMMSWL